MLALSFCEQTQVMQDEGQITLASQRTGMIGTEPLQSLPQSMAVGLTSNLISSSSVGRVTNTVSFGRIGIVNAHSECTIGYSVGAFSGQTAVSTI